MAIVLDTETTGLVAAASRVIEIAIVEFSTGSLLFKSYLNPECDIPPFITELTGITDEMVKDAPKFKDVAAQIHAIISSASAILGWNPLFDKGMLAAEFDRIDPNLAPKWPILVDGKRIWDVFEPREERHLMNGYKRFVKRAGFEGAHGALADTNATRDVILAQVDTFGLRDADGKIIPWEDMDPERKLWFGPSPHILLVDGMLVTNFGKNKGIQVINVDAGFWRWVKERDFPDHVVMVAIKMLDFTGSATLSTQLHSWADKYAQENF